MTQYNIIQSDSSPQSLVVSLAAPIPVITGVIWPSSPKTQGSQCKTDVSYRNDGGDGTIFLRVIDSLGSILASYTSSVAAGETGTVSLYFNMHANDLVLYAQVGVGSTETDTSNPYTLEVLLTIGTSLTLSLPSSVEVGDPVAFSGKLTRADAQPTGIQSIKIIDDVSGTLKATVNTDNNGNYSGSFLAPTTKGTYYYASEFGGASLAMSTYALGSSSSNPRRIAIGVEDEANYIQKIGTALVIATTLTVASIYLS